MASMAFGAAQLLGPMKVVRRRKREPRRRNSKRQISRSVSTRNGLSESTNRWWQPSRATKRHQPHRAAVAALALSEESDESTHVIEQTVIAYEESAQQYCLKREREEEEVLFQEAIADGHRECSRASKLVICPAFFEDEAIALESDPEIGSHEAAQLLGVIDRQALQCLAAA